jgi:hypothetical protein
MPEQKTWFDSLPPLPEEPMPSDLVAFHGVELFLRVGVVIIDGISRWFRASWGEGTCDVYHCVQGADGDKVPTLAYGDYHFCGEHYVKVINAVEAETKPRVTDINGNVMGSPNV